MSNNDNSSKSKIEFTVRITGPDGKVIEKTVSSFADIPTTDQFDPSTRDGFLEDMDSFEKAVVKARNAAGEEITREYLDEAAKKKRRPRRSSKTNLH